MTKINKLGKSTFVIAILSFLLVAVLAFGGTYAYFSAQAKAVDGTITTGHLRVGRITAAADTALKDQNFKLNIDGKIAQPNQVILDDTFGVEVDSNINYYARVKFTVKVEVPTDHEHKLPTGCADAITNAIDALTITPDSDWVPGDHQNEADKAKESSLYYYLVDPITQATAEAPDVAFTAKIQVASKLGLATEGSADGCEYWMDVPVTISLQFEVLQADYLNDGTTAGGKFTAVEGKTVGQVAEAAWTKALTGVEA